MRFSGHGLGSGLVCFRSVRDQIDPSKLGGLCCKCSMGPLLSHCGGRELAPMGLPKHGVKDFAMTLVYRSLSYFPLSPLSHVGA